MTKFDPACLANCVFADFEASSLEDRSWPIELGLAWIEDGRVFSDGQLIRPHRSWGMERWSNVSARVHGISRRELDAGMDAAEVLAWSLLRAAGRPLLFDCVAYDARWLERLREAADGASCPLPGDFHAFAATLPDLAADHAYEFLERHTAVHRARPDAERLARAVLNGLSRAGLLPHSEQQAPYHTR